MQEQKRVSVKDIAAHLNISLSTVHKALTGKSGISEERRKQVLQTAQNLGYVVNTTAQALSRKDMNIGVILPLSWQEYFSHLKRGIEEQFLAMQEYRVNGIFYFVPATPDDAEVSNIKHWLSEKHIDAVLYCASHYSINQLIANTLIQTDCPVFWVGGSTDIPFSISNITVDAELTGRLAADFICCTSSPSVKAAMFTGSMQTGIHKLKTDAFCKRILENGGEVLSVIETEDDPQKAYYSMETLCSRNPELNAIYVNTSTSEPVCRYLEENGLADRITLLGTDQFAVLTDYMKRGIMKATISQNQDEVGRIAAASAYEYLHRINTYGNADWKPERLVLIKPNLLLKANIE